MLRQWLPWLIHPLLALALSAGVWREEHHVLSQFQGPDFAGTAWTWWWTSFSLSRGMNPLNAQWNWQPEGFYPLAQFNIVDALITSPGFWLLSSPEAAYNAGVVLLLALSGLATHAAARLLGTTNGPAMFAGAAVMTTRLLTEELWSGRPGQMFVAPLVLALGLWWHLLNTDSKSKNVAIAAGVFSAITFLSYWYYGLFLVFGVGILCLWQAPQLNRKKCATVALATTVTAIGTLPFVAMLLSVQQDLPGVDLTTSVFDYGHYGRNDPGLNTAIAFSAPWHWPLAPDVVDRRLLWPILIGLIPTKAARPWIAIALTGWLLSMGPWLQGAQHKILLDTPLPWLWLWDHLPFFDRLWWPYRLGVLTTIGMTLAATINLHQFTKAQKNQKLWVLAALLSLAITVVKSNKDLGLLRHTPATSLSPAWGVVDGPTITLPLLSPPGHLNLWFQLQHQQPILYGVGAHLAGHRPPDFEASIRSNPFLLALWSMEGPLPTHISIAPADIDGVLAMGFQQVVLDRSLYRGPTGGVIADFVANLLDSVLGQPTETDHRARVYDITPIHAPITVEFEPGTRPQ